MPDETQPAPEPAPQPVQSEDTGIGDWAQMLRRHIGASPGVMDLESVRSDGSFGYKFRGQRFIVSIRRSG
jgi:hypothetical protein